MNTIARRATIHIADTTAPLAQVIINARFAAIVETLIADIAIYDHACELCGQGTDETFTRLDNRDGAEVEICESCADTADVSYIAD